MSEETVDWILGTTVPELMILQLIGWTALLQVLAFCIQNEYFKIIVLIVHICPGDGLCRQRPG
jgi:hypothetical protein